MDCEKALTMALFLAVIASTKYRARKCTRVAEYFAKRLTPAQVDQCKLDALRMIERANHGPV